MVLGTGAVRRPRRHRRGLAHGGTAVRPGVRAGDGRADEPPAGARGRGHRLQRRVSELLADLDPATLGDRATAAFADAAPAWPTAVYQSVDLQIAARDTAAVERGDYLAVVGDMHPGDTRSVRRCSGCASRPARYFAQTAAEAGSPMVHLLPPFGPGMASTPAVSRSPLPTTSSSPGRTPTRRRAAGRGGSASSRSRDGKSSTAPARCGFQRSRCSRCRRSSAGCDVRALSRDGAHAAGHRRAERVAAGDLERPGD